MNEDVLILIQIPLKYISNDTRLATNGTTGRWVKSTVALWHRTARYVSTLIYVKLAPNKYVFVRVINPHKYEWKSGIYMRRYIITAANEADVTMATGISEVTKSDTSHVVLLWR